MKRTINSSEFHDAFINMGRDNNFSYEGRELLFDYLEQYEEETETEIELDVIALCCEYNEDTFEEVQRNYGIDVEDDGELKETVKNYLYENTVVVGETDTTIIYQAF